jgi:hypothetical protein
MTLYRLQALLPVVLRNTGLPSAWCVKDNSPQATVRLDPHCAELAFCAHVSAQVKFTIKVYCSSGHIVLISLCRTRTGKGNQVNITFFCLTESVSGNTDAPFIACSGNWIFICIFVLICYLCNYNWNVWKRKKLISCKHSNYGTRKLLEVSCHAFKAGKWSKRLRSYFRKQYETRRIFSYHSKFHLLFCKVYEFI